MVLSEAFASSKYNNFNLIRLLAALLVIFSHSFPLTGAPEPHPFFMSTDSYGGLAVYVFLIISGFLVTHSWLRSSNALIYLRSRCLRIFPALLVVILLTILVLGPAFTTLPLPQYFHLPHTWGYLRAMLLFNKQVDLPGVFTHNPYSPSVNGSLWTLFYEFVYYLMICVLGLIGLMKRRWVSLLLFALAYLLVARLLMIERVPHAAAIFNHLLLHSHHLLIFFLYFGIGMLCRVYQDYIPLKGRYALLGLLAICCTLVFGPMTHLLLVFPVAYLTLYFGLHPLLRLPDYARYTGDLSYGIYICAWPIQQLLIALSHNRMQHLENFLLATALTLLCAYVSWHLIEARALKLKFSPMPQAAKTRETLAARTTTVLSE